MSAAWYKTADAIRRAILLDDGRFGLRARTDVQAAIDAAPAAANSPDPDAFNMLIVAARRYAARTVAKERDRIAPIAAAAAQAICDIATEDRRAGEVAEREAAIERAGARAGLPAADRN